jgi:hypothetical protein
MRRSRSMPSKRSGGGRLTPSRACAVGLISLVLITSGCLRTRHPTQFLIPKGYIGWVDISYGVHDTAPLPVEGGYTVVRVPANGKAQTSTEIEAGRAGDQFFYGEGAHRSRLRTSPPGGGGMIWGDSVTGKSRGATREFFVGPESEYRKSHAP